MKIDLSTWEIWNLLKQGCSNQREFIDSLYYTEFEEFLEYIENYYDDEFDLRGFINGGCLFVEDTLEDVEEEWVIYENGRITISLY